MYKGPRSAEAMIKFITDLSTARFHTAASLQQIPEEQFVTISGIEASSHLSTLAGIFTLYPIYHLSS
jgi:hypothetical protein